MTTVRFITEVGEERIVEAKPGESLMQAAVRSGVPGIEGECGGELSCATCHVHIDEPDHFATPSEDEEDLLELVDSLTDRSRLSCQLKVSSSTPDIEIRVPAA